MKQIITTSLTLIFFMLAGAVHAGDCMRLCDDEFWKARPTLDEVKAQLDKGATLGAKKKGGMTDLHAAAVYSTPEVIRLLIDEGADTDPFTAFGLSPLHLAVSYDVAVENIHALLDGGADIEARMWSTDKQPDNKGMTPLHAAASASLENTRILIQVGANIKAKTKKGETPLHVAVKAFRIRAEIVNLLLDEGANPHARDNNRKTPFDYMKNNKKWLGDTTTYRRLRQASQGR